MPACGVRHPGEAESRERREGREMRRDEGRRMRCKGGMYVGKPIHRESAGGAEDGFSPYTPVPVVYRVSCSVALAENKGELRV